MDRCIAASNEDLLTGEATAKEPRTAKGVMKFAICMVDGEVLINCEKG